MEIKAENHVIVVGEKLVKVNADVYQTYYKMKRREKYQLEAELKQGVQYYSSMDSKEFLGEEFLIDENQNVEKTVLEGIERENLHHALSALTDSERRLIIEIFFNERTERGLANILGVYQYAVHKKKRGYLKN